MSVGAHQGPTVDADRVLRGPQAPTSTAPGAGGRPVGGLVASDMFTPASAQGHRVLVREATTAAPSTLGWHSQTPVVALFHTGGNQRLRSMGQEHTRQLDRQMQALSLLSAGRLLEGVEGYRTNGRQAMLAHARLAREKFLKSVSAELVKNYGYSKTTARSHAFEVSKALAVLHESDQLTYGPGQPALEPCLSLGDGPVSSSIGAQGKPLSRALEEAARAVPPEQRSTVRLNIRAVLADRPVSRLLRKGQTHPG